MSKGQDYTSAFYIIFRILATLSTFTEISSYSFSNILTKSNIYYTSIYNVRESSIPFHQKMKPRLENKVDIVLFAKPPPKSFFDLNQIEEYESLLDSNSIDIESIDEDDEDIDFADCSSDSFLEFIVPPELNNQRIDTILYSLDPSKSRSQWGSLLSDNKVSIVAPSKVKTVITRKSMKLEENTIIQIMQNDLIQDQMPTEIVPQDLPLSILYEDEHMIVINKSAGMVVHPAAGNWDGTVVNALAHYLAYKSPYGTGEFVGSDGKVSSETADDITIDGTDGEASTFRPGVVHRLDKGTTGVLVLAKSKNALAILSEAFANRQVKKTYVAITVGNPGKRVVIDKPIGRHPLHRQKMRVVPETSNRDRIMSPYDRMVSVGVDSSNSRPVPNSLSKSGRRALSLVDTLHFDGKLSMVQVRIETGRTHQIRVHLQDRTTPIYGDDVYGLKDWNQRLKKSHGVDRPLLHAYRLELEHPITKERMVFVAPLADDMLRIATAIWPDGPKESELFINN